MNGSRDKVRSALNHRNTGSVPVDFGATAVTGIHCRIVEALRNYYGLEPRPVKIVEAFQMLGEVDAELAEKIGVDCIGIGGPKDIFDLDVTRMREQTTPWGQLVLVPEAMDLTPDAQGDVYVHAGGDKSYPPSAVMPKGCYFINAIERQYPIDEEQLNPEDNVEEFGLLTEGDLAYYRSETDKAYQTGRAVVASFGGTALGDVAFVPGMGLKQPKGIRSVVEWYMSTAMRQDYLHQVFEKEIDIAIANYEKLWAALGDKIEVVLTCGTDFGSQESQFCSIDTFRELWLPHYRRMNDWIHQHAKDMDSRRLKEEFGSRLTFWGGGGDTQKILPFGTPDEIRRHVKEQCEILGRDGGFVFNAVHNIQANVPVENVVAMFDALKDFR